MSPTGEKGISASVEIARSPEDVFEYLADPAHLPDWQPEVRSAAFEDPVSVGVGSRGREVRHVMGADRPITWEVTDYRPGERYAVRGVDGPVRAVVTMDLSPESGGAGTRLRYGMDFEGHGIGKLIAVLARKGASKDVRATLGRLKRELESARR